MATNSVPPPPTYADPVLVDKISGKPTFNPIWLNWFLQLAQLLTGAGPAHAVTAITPPASGGVWQNTTGFDVIVTSDGGAGVTFALSRDNITFFANGSTQTIIPVVRGDYLQVTYGAAPTLNYFAM